MAKGIVVSLRLKPYHLALGYDYLKAYDKSVDIQALSTIVRGIFMHGLVHLNNGSIKPTNQAVEFINAKTIQHKDSTQPVSFDSLLTNKKLKDGKIRNEATTKLPSNNPYANISPLHKVTPLHEEKTESIINTVTDFSPLTEEELKGETDD